MLQKQDAFYKSNGWQGVEICHIYMHAQLHITISSIIHSILLYIYGLGALIPNDT